MINLNGRKPVCMVHLVPGEVSPQLPRVVPSPPTLSLGEQGHQVNYFNHGLKALEHRFQGHLLMPNNPSKREVLTLLFIELAEEKSFG